MYPINPLDRSPVVLVFGAVHISLRMLELKRAKTKIRIKHITALTYSAVPLFRHKTISFIK